MINQQLDKAFNLVKEGEKRQAIIIIKEILKQEPENVSAWWLMANALSDEDEKINCLERVLVLDPSHQKAQKLMDKLNPDLTPSIAEIMESPFPEHQSSFVPKNKNEFEPETKKNKYLVYGLLGVAVLAVLFFGFTMLSGLGTLEDSPSSYSSFTVGDSQTVHIATSGSTDIDFYANGIVTIIVEGYDNFDPTVQILNSQGQIIAENDDHASNISGLNALDSAVQYVRMSGQGVIRIGEFWGETEGRATVRIMSAHIEDVSVGSIDVGESRTVNIPSSGIVELILRGNERITVTAQGDGITDPILQIISENGEVLGYNDDSYDYTGNINLSELDAAIENIQISGMVYIRITEFSNQAGEITITVR